MFRAQWLVLTWLELEVQTWLQCQTMSMGYLLQCESKNPPEDLWQFFQNSCVPIHGRLRIFIQLPATLTKLCITTQFISCAQNVHHRPKRMLAFSDIFLKRLRIFSPNFTCLLSIHIYTKMQMYIQLCPTVTKLCHIRPKKCDHPACVSCDGGHFEHIMVVALNMA